VVVASASAKSLQLPLGTLHGHWSLLFPAWTTLKNDKSGAEMTRKRPTKPRNQIARKPSWIADVQNQNRWTRDFAKRLQEIKQSDATISAICGNHQVLRHCAAQVRLYADLAVTTYLRQERNRRGKKQVARLKAAIKGIGEAVEFYLEFGNDAAASQLDSYKRDLSEKLQRGKQAYSSKRHGRDRDHTILVRLQVFLERHVGQVTNSTLATLVNKAMEVDNRAESERFTEETVRKNLKAFRGKNSAMMTLLASEANSVRNQSDAI
jgi:hypothetical protein